MALGDAMSRTGAGCLVLAGLLFGCEASSPSAPNVLQLTEGDRLFYDNFNRTTGMGGAWTVTLGAFTTDGAFARGTVASSYAFWVGQPDLDGTVEASVSAPNNGYVGVVARASATAPDSDHYAAYLDPEGRVGLARRTDYFYSYLGTGPVASSGTHVLALRAVGGGPVTLSVWLDGQEVIHAVDSSGDARSGGRVGLFDYSGKAQPLDDFTVIVGSAVAAPSSPDLSTGSARDAAPADGGAGAGPSSPDLSTGSARDGAPANGGATDASAAGSAILFQDNFQRTGALGSSWGIASGAFSASGSTAIGTAPGSYAYWTGQPDPDGTVSIRIVPPRASTYAGVILRADPAAPDRDHYAAYVQPDGFIGLARRDAYAYTYLGNGPQLVAGAHELSLTASGRGPVVLSVKLDGVEVIRTTDGSPQARTSTGRSGMFDYEGAAQALDDFAVRTDGGGPAVDGGAAVDVGTSGGGSATDMTVAPGGSNPVAIENALAGDPGWRQTWLASASDLSGYFSTDSAIAGETVTGFVHSAVQAPISWTLYRIGWYGGAGARKVAGGQFTGRPQPACPKDSGTGLVECGWNASFSFPVPAGWLSGVYIAKLTRPDGPEASMIVTVRDARAAALVVQQSVTTWQAYNDYGGESLYVTQLGLPQGHAVKVSFARPYADPAGQFLEFEADFVHWLEAEGFDATYVTNLDFSRNPDTALRGRTFLSVGHNEYWSGVQRDALERARDRGVWQGYFSADTGLVQIRTEPGATGAFGRIICYKDTSDPLGATSQATVRFRDPPVLRPENGLLGVMSDSWNPVNVPIAVDAPGHWLFAGTGLTEGDTIGQLAGYEVDRMFANGAEPAGAVRLAGHSVVAVAGTPNRHELAIYTASSGATVLGVGTIEWGWGLGAPGLADPRLQRITTNFLRAGGASPATPGAAPAGTSAWSRADTTGATSSVTTIAGIPGTHGSTDGAAAAATFDRPSGVAVGSDGSIYVSDAAAHRIRRLQSGVVSTLAGGTAGAVDGTGSQARFRGPQGLTFGPGGALYVADTANHCIRMVTTAGVVSTYAGVCGSSGLTDGSSGAARFGAPQAIAVGPSGALYVADTGNNAIRKIAAGRVTTLAASPGGNRTVFHVPNAIAVGADETVYVTDSGHRSIKRVSTTGVVSTMIADNPASAPYHLPDWSGGGFNDGDTSRALAMPGHGLSVIGSVLYFSDAGNDRIRRLDLGSGRVTTFAGSGRARCEDGSGKVAGFEYPQGLGEGPGALYVADSCGAVRRIAVP
jgi:hypothetical protein